MSAEEGLELQDLVAQTLELNGCLPKIRAQLRANLFLALDEDSKISKQQPLLNTKLKSSLEAPEGQLMFCLVREFLEYFDLDFTISVYEPESCMDTFYKYEGREKIIEELGLKPTEDNLSDPLLLHLVKLAQTKSKTLNINLNINDEQKNTNANGLSSSSLIQEEINGHSPSNFVNQKNGLLSREDEASNSMHIIKKSVHLSNGNQIQNEDLNSTYTKTGNDDTLNGTSSIEEESPEKVQEEESTTPSDQDSPKSEDKSKSAKSDKLKTKLELPPLQINKSRDLLPSLYSKDFKEKSSKEYDFEIKDDYEEDFMSGSDIELSGSKTHTPKPLLEELQHASLSTNNSGSKISISSPDNLIERVSVESDD